MAIHCFSDNHIERVGMMKTELITVLKTIGKSVETLTCPDGTEILVLPYGGRILGLFSPKTADNFFWTNTALETIESARNFYSKNDWHNSGGDRTWLSPEIDFFFPKFPDTSVYSQPRQLDAGEYHIEKTNNMLFMDIQLTMTPLRTMQPVKLQINKVISPALNPLRYELDCRYLGELEYAGFTLRTSLNICDNDGNSTSVGIWSLLQLPHGGDLIMPTYSKTAPKIYCGNIPHQDLSIKDKSIVYKMRAKGGYKIGIRSFASTGRIGYVYQTGDNWALVIKNFFVNPSGEYIDVPYDDPADYGYCVQACNADMEQYSFSELEYHAPSVGKNTGRKQYEDSSQIWAFRGTLENISMIVKKLLSPDYQERVK